MTTAELLQEFKQEPCKSSEPHRKAIVAQLKSRLTEKEYKRLSNARGDSFKYDVDQLILKYNG